MANDKVVLLKKLTDRVEMFLEGGETTPKEALEYAVASLSDQDLEGLLIAIENTLLKLQKDKLDDDE